MRRNGKSKHRTPSSELCGSELINEDKYRTFADCVALLIRNPKELRNIPEVYKGYRLFTATAEKNPQIISYIPPHMLEMRLCRYLVEANKKSLALLPQAVRTEELLLLHIQTHKNGIEDLTDEEKTYKMYFEAVKLDKSYIMNVPQELVSQEMCYESLSGGNGMNLFLIPIEMQNVDMCIFALRNGCSPAYIPKVIAQTEAVQNEIKNLKSEIQHTKKGKTKKSRKIATLYCVEKIDK